VLALTAVLALTDDVEAMTYDASANRVSAFFFFFGLMAGGTNSKTSTVLECVDPLL